MGIHCRVSDELLTLDNNVLISCCYVSALVTVYNAHFLATTALFIISLVRSKLIFHSYLYGLTEYK